MAPSLDWDAAARRDRVRDHGSIPSWADVAEPKSRKRRPEDTKTGQALAQRARERAAWVVAEFVALDLESRIASYKTYCKRIHDVCAAERRMVPLSRTAYVAAIDGAERELIRDLKKRVTGAQRAMRSPRDSAETALTNKRRRRTSRAGARVVNEINVTVKQHLSDVEIAWNPTNEATAWLVVLRDGTKVVASKVLDIDVHQLMVSTLASLREVDNVIVYPRCGVKIVGRGTASTRSQ